MVLRYDSIAATGAGLGVALLDQKPVLCVPPSAHAHKSPTPAKPFSFQLELERTVFVGFDGIPLRHPGAAIPNQYRPRSIFSLGNHTLEIGIFERVILDLHSEPLYPWIEARSFRQGPTLEHAVELQPEIVVQAPRGMLLDDEPPR